MHLQVASKMCTCARNVIIPTHHDLRSIKDVYMCKERHHPHPTPPQPTPHCGHRRTGIITGIYIYIFDDALMRIETRSAPSSLSTFYTGWCFKELLTIFLAAFLQTQVCFACCRLTTRQTERPQDKFGSGIQGLCWVQVNMPYVASAPWLNGLQPALLIHSA